MLKIPSFPNTLVKLSNDGLPVQLTRDGPSRRTDRLLLR